MQQFNSWLPYRQEEFLDFCTGARGVKILYDSFFKEILNPEYTPERLNRLLSVLLRANVRIKYHEIKEVYTIVFIEGSTVEFREFPENYLHYFEQRSDTGLKLDLLQKYLFIPLDIFSRNIQNKGIRSETDAWLAFLSQDDPGMILRLIDGYPEFRPMYEDVYRLCQNVEKVMGMFSEELRILDRNTVQYMMDEMQAEIDSQKAEIGNQKAEIERLRKLIDEMRK